MRRFIAVFLASLLAAGWAFGPSMAQEVTVGGELSLDSLLSMPVSSAAKYDQKQTDAPAFVTIVTREEIRRFGYRTLADVLQNQVGFYSGNDREYSDVGARGFGRPGYYNNKILVLVDGHALNDGYTGGTRLGSALGIDMDAVDRIEIVRGPGSAVYGARAMLGVVNMVTRKGRDLDGFEVIGDLGTPQALGASVNYGRVLGTESDLAVSASWSSADGRDIYFPELDAPILNNGVAEGLDWDRYARGLVTFRSGRLALQGSVSSRRKGIPTGAYRTSFNHPEAESGDLALFAEARFSQELGAAGEVTFRGYADSYENEGIYPFSTGDHPQDTLASGKVGSLVEIGSVGGELRMRWDPAQSQRLVFGLEVQRVYKADHNLTGPATGPPTGDHPYSILSGYIHEEFQISPELSLTLGIRRDEYSTRGSATTPRGALVYHPFASTTFKLLGGEAFRAPNILEMHVNQPEIALLSNPELEAEKIRSFEFVWEQRIGRMATTVTAFHNEIRDLIDLVEIRAPDSLSHLGRLAFEQQNISDAHAVGFEVETRATLPLGILAKAGYGFTSAKDANTEEPLVNAPRHLFRLSASGVWDRVGTLAANVRSESGRRTLYGLDTDLNTVVDVAATSPTYMDCLSFQLMVKNLLDTSYFAPGGFQHVQSSIPQPGRVVTLRASIIW